MLDDASGPSQLLMLLAVLGVAVVVFALAAKPWFERRVRRPGRVRWTAVAGAAAVAAAGGVCGAVELPAGVLLLVGLICAGALAGVGAYVATNTYRGPTSRAPRRIVALGAHPDDIELACSGTLTKFIDAGHEVRLLVMSSGSSGGHSQDRIADAHRGAEFLGAATIKMFDFPDTRMDECGREMTQAIETELSRYNPDLILTHSGHDQHQDHAAVHRATLRAGRGYQSILCYESPSATRDFNPSAFVDITDQVAVKVAAVKAHRDQSDKPYMSRHRVEGVAAFRGAQVRRPYAEGFEPVRLLGDDL